MPEQQTPEQARPEGAPQWFQDHIRDLSGAFQQTNAQIAALRQQVAQPPLAQRPVAPPPDVQLIRGQIHDRIINEPERVLGETVAFAEQRADAKIQQAVGQIRHELEAKNFNERMWGDFWAANPDCGAFPDQVYASFQRQPAMHSDPATDWSMRANAARDEVRQRMQMVTEAAKQTAQREQQQRRAMAGAPGSGFGGPDRGDAQRQEMSDIDRTAQAVAERNAFIKRGDAYTKLKDEGMRVRQARVA